jgi:hypothetical protein
MSHANLSRRAIMAGAATLPALTVPALAAVDNSDAELLRLGAKLAVVDQERTTQLAIDRAEREATEFEAERRSGITWHDAFAAGDFSSFCAIRSQIRCELGSALTMTRTKTATPFGIESTLGSIPSSMPSLSCGRLRQRG